MLRIDTEQTQYSQEGAQTASLVKAMYLLSHTERCCCESPVRQYK
jgi:hypothetical protein